MALVSDRCFRRFGQLEPGPAAAATAEPPGTSFLSFYFVAVAAGVTVFLITRALDRRKRSHR